MRISLKFVLNSQDFIIRNSQIASVLRIAIEVEMGLNKRVSDQPRADTVLANPLHFYAFYLWCHFVLEQCKRSLPIQWKRDPNLSLCYAATSKYSESNDMIPLCRAY